MLVRVMAIATIPNGIQYFSINNKLKHKEYGKKQRIESVH